MPLRHRGYGAYISCDGEELKTYNVKQKGRIISCYVLGEAEKDLRVCWIDSKPPTHLSIEVRMDGRRLGVVSHNIEPPKNSRTSFKISLNSQCLNHFIPNSVSDELPSIYSDDLGTVDVMLRRVNSWVPRVTSNIRADASNMRQRSRKGASQKPSPAQSTILYPRLRDDEAWVIFRFMYRPKAFLEVEGIRECERKSRPRTQSSGGRRNLPSSSVSSPAREDSLPPPKRQRTVYDKEDSVVSYADDTSELASALPEDDEGENVVEVHLNSKENYAIPGTRYIRVKREPSPSVKEEPTTQVKQEWATLVKHEHTPSGKFPWEDSPTRRQRRSRESSPARMTSDGSSPTPHTRHRRRTRLSGDTLVPSAGQLSAIKRQCVKMEEEDVTLVGSESSHSDAEDKENVREVHLKSRNGFRCPDVRGSITVKNEPSDTGIKQESALKEEIMISDNTHSVKAEPSLDDARDRGQISSPEPEEVKPSLDGSDDDGDETLVEIHISSKDIRAAYASGEFPKRELDE